MEASKALVIAKDSFSFPAFTVPIIRNIRDFNGEKQLYKYVFFLIK